MPPAARALVSPVGSVGSSELRSEVSTGHPNPKTRSPTASFFEKKLDQKTLHRFFQGFPSALERGSESLSLSEPVVTKEGSVYLAVRRLVCIRGFCKPLQQLRITNYELSERIIRDFRFLLLAFRCFLPVFVFQKFLLPFSHALPCGSSL